MLIEIENSTKHIFNLIEKNRDLKRTRDPGNLEFFIDDFVERRKFIHFKFNHNEKQIISK